MTFKTNESRTGRDFKYLPAGDNGRSGFSISTALADPYEAIDNRLPNLDPPIDSANRASIDGSGTYSNTLNLPQYVAASVRETSIVSFLDTPNLILNGDHTVELGSLLNFVAGGILVESAANTRVKCIVNAAVVNGVNGIGLNLSGISDDSSYELTQGELRVAGATLIKHTATSDTPISHRVNVVEFFDINQTFITYDSASSSETILTVAAVQPSGTAISTAGSVVFDIVSGRLVVSGQEIVGESLANIASGARLTLKANVCEGNTLIEDGGEAAYKSLGLLTGDIETQGTGQMLTTVGQMIGDALIGVGSTLVLNTDLIIGDITVNGRLDGVILNHIGTLTNNGTINGIINGVRYGNWVIKKEIVVSSKSTGNQNPIGTDNPLQIEFGAAQLPELDALGTFTAPDTGQYEFTYSFQYGRTGAGGVSWLFFYLEVDGVQEFTSRLAKLDNSNSDFPADFSPKPIDLLAGQEVKTYLVRDSQGNNSGGLLTESSSIAIDDSPSASITVTRVYNG